tara:strand:- start:3782 stop:3952 length:171 start_codon:yes stop_codon:yes gene_type:complete
MLMKQSRIQKATLVLPKKNHGCQVIFFHESKVQLSSLPTLMIQLIYFGFQTKMELV